MNPTEIHDALADIADAPFDPNEFSFYFHKPVMKQKLPRPKSVPSTPYRLVAYVDAAFVQQILHVPKR
jgi:hypothetical protein